MIKITRTLPGARLPTIENGVLTLYAAQTVTISYGENVVSTGATIVIPATMIAHMERVTPHDNETMLSIISMSQIVIHRVPSFQPGNYQIRAGDALVRVTVGMKLCPTIATSNDEGLELHANMPEPPRPAVAPPPVFVDQTTATAAVERPPETAAIVPAPLPPPELVVPAGPPPLESALSEFRSMLFQFRDLPNGDVSLAPILAHCLHSANLILRDQGISLPEYISYWMVRAMEIIRSTDGAPITMDRYRLWFGSGGEFHSHMFARPRPSAYKRRRV